jgi:hypothetical protein
MCVKFSLVRNTYNWCNDMHTYHVWHFRKAVPHCDLFMCLSLVQTWAWVQLVSPFAQVRDQLLFYPCFWTVYVLIFLRSPLDKRLAENDSCTKFTSTSSIWLHCWDLSFIHDCMFSIVISCSSVFSHRFRR